MDEKDADADLETDVPVLLVGVGLGLLQIGESCGILIVGGYIEGRCVLAGAGFGDR